MARLPEQRKILPEDFPDQKWIAKLLAPINRFFEVMTQALNKGITFKENIDGDIIPVIIDGVFPVDLPWNRPRAPMAAWIGKCYEIDGNHTNFTDPLFLDWEYTAAGKFRINNVTGLSASSTNKYNLTIVAITG